jgi:PAS domain S-box-containing protein
MKNKAPIPENESLRLAALRSFHIKYTLPEEQYDRLTKLASIICETPIAYISFMDGDKQWFKSKIGVKAAEMPREASLCQYTIMGQDILEIEDALQDERVKNNPLVTGQPHLRFYAGQPLVENNIAYGSLCVIDNKPKKLSETQKIALKILAQEVLSQMHLRKKEVETEKLEKLFSMSIDVICVAGTDGYFKKVNPAFKYTLGFEEDELLGRPFADFLHPDDVVESLKEVERLGTGIKTVGFENRFKTKAGNYRLFSWVANPDAATGELYCIGRDITEQRATEQKLSKVQKRHMTFFNNSQGIMSTHDMRGNLLNVNPAGAKMLGYTKEELEKKNLVDVLSPETKENVKPYLKLLKENRRAEGLMTVMSKQGEIKTWKYNNILIADGDEEYAIGNALDITELIYIENELKKAKDLAEQNAMAKDIFLANMSHEVRTPMNAIIGFSELLASTKLNLEQTEFIDSIRLAGENLLVIINDILDFSKIESNSLTLEKVPINLREITNHVKKLLAQKAKEKKISFNLYVEDELPDYVLGDKVRLAQILINTIGNAIKFTEKGKVDVFCQVVVKDEASCQIEIKIKDTGIGIQSDKQAIIFERFKQADSDTTRKYGGTGLGLSISKKLVELFGGTIQVFSEVGSGSEFTIQLPFKIAKGYKADAVRQKKDAPSHTNIHVLLVEDNELNQKLAKKILEKNHIKVEIVGNGQEAVTILKTQTFDLIMMDLQMPVMDGYVATEYIRNTLKLQTPIVAITAHSLVGEKAKCIDSGMNDYLSKPFKASELVEKILKLVTGTKISPKKTDVKKAVKPDSKQLKQKSIYYDISYIEELADGDKLFIIETIETFLRTVPQDIQDMEKHILNNDLAAIKKTAHKMKTSYGTFKAVEAIETCNAIEHSNNISGVKVKFKLLNRFSAFLVEDIKQLLKRLAR